MIKKAESELRELASERPPELTVSEDEVQELADFLKGMIQRTDNPAKLRQFFASFIARVTLGQEDVHIEYRPDRLLKADTAVRSKGIWLPGRDSNPRPSG